MSRSKTPVSSIPIAVILIVIAARFVFQPQKTSPNSTPTPSHARTRSRQAQVPPEAQVPPPATDGNTGTMGTTQSGDSNEGNLLLGNPSGAATQPDNFLLERPQYTMSFNHARGGPNWVAWHVDAADLGTTERGKFRPDPDLPAKWRITPNDYKGSGYDRGHMCPSADRNGTKADNDTTFYMSNMVPQTAELNQHVWADFEDAVRQTVRAGNEVYQVCGVAGEAGTIANGKVTVPALCWKIVLVLPAGTGDLARINAKSRVIAISMPNQADETLKNGDWHTFLTTPRQIAATTGLDFFAALPAKVKTALAAKKDVGD